METAIATVTNSQELVVSDSLKSQVAQFLASLDIAEASRATYSRSLKRFVGWLQNTGRSDRLPELKRGDILAYKEELLSSGRSAYTVSTYLVVVRQLFEWLEAMKIYPNIARGIKGIKKPKGFRKDCLTEEQLREALESMDNSRIEGMRDYALFNLVVRTGLRTIEASRATIGDIRQESGQAVLWVQGKGRAAKDDFVILTEEAHRPIREYLNILRNAGPLSGDAPLFCSHSDRNKGQALTTRSISRIIKEAFRKVGMDSARLTAHSLRHTAITLAIKGGASLAQAQAMARHTDPKTTLIYFHNIDRVKNGAEKCISF